jgi:nuclear GTP-binding protein
MAPCTCSCSPYQHTPPLLFIISLLSMDSLKSALQSGKSAFINSLPCKTALDITLRPHPPTAQRPYASRYALEVTLEINGKPVVFIDTPGLAWRYSEDLSPEDRVHHRAQDILLRNKGRIDHLKDPIPPVSYIVSRAETEDLMVHYCLPAFAKGDVDAFLMAVARANALIKKVRKNPLA